MKRNFFNRILITYSLIICLVLVLVFSLFIFYIQGDMRRQIDSYNDESFASYVMSYENAFESFRYIAQNIKATRSMDQFAFSSSGDYYPRMTALQRDLGDYSSLVNSLVTTGGYHFLVHKSTDERVITSWNTSRLDILLDDLGISSRQYREVVADLGKSRRYSGAYIFTDSKILYISQKDYVDAKLIVTVYTDLQNLNLYPLDPEMQVGLLIDDPKVTDLRTAPDQAGVDTTDRLSAMGRISEQMVDGARYRWSPSAYLGLNYYYRVDDSKALETTAAWIGQMALLLVLSCSAAFGVIAMFSVRLYRPVERLLNTFLSFDINGNHSAAFQNDIDFIAQSALQIRNRNQELVKQLEQNTRELKADLVESLLQDSIHPDAAMQELHRHGIEWLDGETVPVLFSLPEIRGEAGRGADRMTGILEEQIHARYQAVSSLGYSGRLCFVIRQPDPTKLKVDLQEIVTVIDTALQLLVTAYVGPPSEGLHTLRSSFVAANRIVENRHRMPTKNIYDFSDYQKLPAETVVYPIHNEVKLLEAVEAGDSREVHRLLDYLFREYVEKAYPSKEARDLILFALVNTINRAQQQMGVTMEQVAGQDQMVYLELRMCKTVEELRAYVAALFDHILQAVESNSEQATENFRGRLAEYISGNLHRDISLLDLAEHFNLSPNYMSALFKSTMGDNFKESLSRARFDRAVELLREDPTIKMNSLCEQVGLNHPNTLIRLFKKYSGLSPVQYVKEHILV